MLRLVSIACSICVLFVGLAFADSPEICAPDTATDKYRLLRQLSLDLRGRIPTADEYEALHHMDGVTPGLIEDMLASADFLGQLRKYHRDLLWTGITGSTAFSPGQRLGRTSNGIWFIGARRLLYRGSADKICHNQEGGFEPDGRPTLINIDGDVRDGWVWRTPYWSDQPIKVCAYDAQDLDEGPDGNGNIQSCAGMTGVKDCGCGNDLRRCFGSGPHGNEAELLDALIEEPARVFEHIISAGRPYHQALTTLDTMINGKLAHIYKHLAAPRSLRMRDLNFSIIPDIPYSDDAWVPLKRNAPHSGVLTTAGFLFRFASDRSRVNRFYTAFLCQPFVPDDSSVADGSSDTEPDISKRNGCAGCHSTIEPAAVHWGRFRNFGFFGYLPPADYAETINYCAVCQDGTENPCNNKCDQYYLTQDKAEPGTPSSELGKLDVLAWRTQEEAARLDMGPSALISEYGKSQAIRECAVRTMAEHLYRRPLSAKEESGWLVEMTQQFQRDGDDLRALVRMLIHDERYRGLR